MSALVQTGRWIGRTTGLGGRGGEGRGRGWWGRGRGGERGGDGRGEGRGREEREIHVWYINSVCTPGNVINIQTGQWTGRMSGLGAGIDSFYEYLLKVCWMKVIGSSTLCGTFMWSHLSRVQGGWLCRQIGYASMNCFLQLMCCKQQKPGMKALKQIR